MDAVSIRGDWVGQVIDGRFSLLEWLGGSGDNGVFVTQLAGSGVRAAIKLIPASAQAEDRLALWASAASLSHPHLLRVLHYGRAEIEETKLVYIVTDLASELLSQIIPERPLTSDETREMLGPVLDALRYLHGAGYVHGHLKPSNILVVENEIRLSSDGLLHIDSLAPGTLVNDLHSAPEIAGNPVAPAADTWSLGVTLVEALTQEPPIWDSASQADPVVPASVPEPFSAIARECLRPNPSRRCTLASVRAMLDGKSRPSAAQSPLPPPLPRPPSEPSPYSRGEKPAPPATDPLSRASKLGSPRTGPGLRDEKPLPAKMPLLPLFIGLVLLAAIVIGFLLHRRKTDTVPLQTDTTQQAPPAAPESKTSSPQTQPVASAPQSGVAVSPSVPAAASSTGDVLSRDVPDVPRSASNTVHGTVSVVVRVAVDATGAVTNADFAVHGPSAYFARLALESARNWKFKPPRHDSRTVPSTWLLHYKFRRTGAEVTPEETSSR